MKKKLFQERIRIKQKRKPPTRRGQSSPSTAEPTSPSGLTTHATNEDDLFVTSPSSVSEEVVTTPAEKSSDLGHAFLFDEPPPLPTAAEDIFGDDDDIFADPLPEPRMPKVDSSYSFEPPPLPTDAAVDDYDLFAEIGSGGHLDQFSTNPITESEKSPPKEIAPPAPQPKIVDVVQLPEKSQKESPRRLETTPDDIFGTDEVPVHDDIFDADDDIFSTVPVRSSDVLFEAPPINPPEDIFQSAIEPPAKSTVKQDSLKSEVLKPAFLLDDDSDSDDFFFGPSSAPVKKVDNPVVAQPQKFKSIPDADPFAQNENLLAQAASSNKNIAPPQLERKKVHQPKVQDIFAADDDDEDIFAPRDTNLPVIEKKKKEEPRQIFSNDDDLFGESPAPAAKKVAYFILDIICM